MQNQLFQRINPPKGTRPGLHVRVTIESDRVPCRFCCRVVAISIAIAGRGDCVALQGREVIA